MSKIKRVLIVGSAEQSGGGVATVIRLMKQMPVWEKYHCYWLGTQIQADKWTKLRYALTAYLKALIIIWRYDIVHFHTVPNVSMKIQLPVFLLALLGRKKIILHLHVGNQLTMEQYINYKLAHWCMRKADMLVLLSDTFVGFLDDYWKDVNTPRRVIYNACKEVIAIPYEHHKKTILFVGTFNKNKAADLLIDAFNIFHKKYPDWHLQLLGSGSEESLYKMKILEYGLADNIEMPGYLAGAELEPYFQSAGVYAMCSYVEGFPMVVLEAWAYGVPVISTPVGGLPDVLQEGRNSLLFDFGDTNGLAEKLALMADNYELRQKMSIYSTDFVKKNFSIEVVNFQLSQLYNSI